MDPRSDEFTYGVYWRQSMWNGRKCVPVILSAAPGRLRLSGAQGPVFDVSTDDVTATFGTYSIRLTVAGRRYDIVGRGSNISPDFTPAMKAELEAAKDRMAAVGRLPWLDAFDDSNEPVPNALAAIVDPASVIGSAVWTRVLRAAGVRAA